MGKLNDRGHGKGKYQRHPDSAYNDTHDAFYWKDTGEWIEPKCGDPECGHCKDRPPTAAGGQE